MEYVDVKSGLVTKEMNGTTVMGPKDRAPVQGPPPGPALPLTPPVELGSGTAVAQGQKFIDQIPPIPVYMDDDERFVDFRKPGFWSYTPSVFSFAFGLVLFVLFTAGGAFLGFLLGLLIWVGLMLFVRTRLWKRTGYWFTSHKLVIHDGSKTRLVPYDEIALSSLAFEGQDCMFSTVYHQEIVLKGILDMDQVVAFISRKVKEAKGATSNGKAANHSK